MSLHRPHAGLSLPEGHLKLARAGLRTVQAFRQTRVVRASNRKQRESCRCRAGKAGGVVSPADVAAASTTVWLLSQLPAHAAEQVVDFSKGSFSTESYVVTLGLFLISLPGEILAVVHMGALT